ncbi:putative pentatricopeptide repeat-containing protein [Acorus calamus]|uniref:Pentatricopeptide repeat-containing protein n=1 Tax=Acorus calamus TaxID=4465 RepID=A0AAV9EZ96_ACOCL|nr:putative pentatricopeptide repeat-containing protein [Acorus calamus]
MTTIQALKTPNFFSPDQSHHPHHHHHHPPNEKQPNHPLFAHNPLDQIPHSDTHPWNTLITTHISHSHPLRALSVYRHMLLRRLRPDRHTLPRVLHASRLSDNPFHGRLLHAHSLKLGLASDPYVLTALMSMYARFEGAAEARRVLVNSPSPNSVSRTLLVSLYAAEGSPDSALEAFFELASSVDAEVDAVALAAALRACAQTGSARLGKRVHNVARRVGLEFDALVGNSILKMYFDCGCATDAREFFDRMRVRDAVSWTTAIGWYVKHGRFNEGLKLLRAMCFEGKTRPDTFTVSAALPACARVAARNNGKELHAFAVRGRLDSHRTVRNALMDMYVKSGRVDSAREVFVKMTDKDVVSWTIMILGHSLHGQGDVGLELFHEMERTGGVTPDQTAYAAALHACNTAILIEEGRVCFNRIEAPEPEHLSLMVGLLARAGRFEEARAFINGRRIGRCADVLRALIGGCRIHRNIAMGRRIAERLIELEPLNAENYVMLLNGYASIGKFELAGKMNETIGDMGLKPKKACSWIEVRNKVHVFDVGDVSHPRSEGVYWELRSLIEGRARSEEDFGLHDVDEERECVRYGHSELLAIGFGLISGRGGPVFVTKNMRVCRDCHGSAKAMSKIVGREIVLKDPERFHHFKDGLCSCRDYW